GTGLPVPAQGFGGGGLPVAAEGFGGAGKPPRAGQGVGPRQGVAGQGLSRLRYLEVQDAEVVIVYGQLEPEFGTAGVGGGPGAEGLLVSASRGGRATGLLQGVAEVDPTPGQVMPVVRDVGAFVDLPEART